jgi:hypothetical protein
METAQLRIVFVFTDLILPLLIGYYIHQKKWLSGEFCNWLIKFNIIIVCTVLTILSFWVLPLTLELMWLPLFGIIFCIIPGLISAVTALRRYQSPLDRGSYLVSSMLSNLGTLGGLCAFILYGEIGFAYAQMVGIFQNMVLVLFCFPLAQYYYQQYTATTTKRTVHLDFRNMFLSWNQLPVLGMFLGMFLYLADIPRPAILSTVFSSLIHIGAWTALLPVGYLINLHAAQKYYHKIFDLIPIKFILTPLVVYIMITHLFTDQIILGTMMVLAITPTAINAVITARLFKLNVDLTIAAFILTTVIYLLIVFPLLFFYITSGNTL